MFGRFQIIWFLLTSSFISLKRQKSFAFCCWIWKKFEKVIAMKTWSSLCWISFEISSFVIDWDISSWITLIRTIQWWKSLRKTSEFRISLNMTRWNIVFVVWVISSIYQFKVFYLINILIKKFKNSMQFSATKIYNIIDVSILKKNCTTSIRISWKAFNAYRNSKISMTISCLDETWK